MQEEQLDGQNGHEGGLSSSANSPPTLSLPAFPLAGNTMGVPKPPIWPQKRPLHLHKDVETCDSSFGEAENKMHSLPKRHVNSATEQEEAPQLAGALGLMVAAHSAVHPASIYC